jgi:PKD repeat protein
LRYAWDFNNDGSTDSTAQNPSFTYSTIGTFTVKLKVTNDVGSDTTTKSNFITVSENQSGGSHAGIALTFDDDTVDAWYATREILQRYNAHVTFFVSDLSSLDQSDINELKLLQSDGNEIAFHGYNHEDQEEYLQNHTLNDYMNNEIIRGVNLMKSWGLNPVDFAYPYGHDDPATTQALEGYFGHMRDTSYDWEDPLIYYQYGSNQPFISGMGIDDITYNQSLDINNIYTGISQAKTDHKILIFYGHKTVVSNPAEYETSFDRLEKILQYASNNSMKTYTISEIH